MKYPEGNPKGKALFFALEEKAKQKKYDDEFLIQLIEYRHMYPESEHFDIFYGKYAAFHGNYHLALEHGIKAYQRRKVCLEVWRLLIECYLALGQPEKAVPFQGYCSRFYGEHPSVTVSLDKLPQCLGELSVTMGVATYAPLCETVCSLEEGQLSHKPGVFCGEFLPLSTDRDGYAYWIGAYNELGMLGGHGGLLECAGGLWKFSISAGADFTYDIMRSKVEKACDVNPEGGTWILPVASASNENQEVEFRGTDVDDTSTLGQWEYGFFRIDKPTRISSAQPLAFGRPIRLGHSDGRRKFVLNILVDALSWNVLRREGFRHMPHTMDFFSRGVIFDQHFSVGEYTYPSLVTIETGMYPHHSQIFHERAAVQLDEEYVTLSERMKELGYYCVNVMGGGNAIYNGASRGYDRLLVTAYDMPAYAGTERVIRQLEAFSECDQFLFLHLMECHPWSSKSFPVGMGTQTKIALKERLRGKERKVPSVYLPNSLLYQTANRQAMEHVDRSLHALFGYITEHYSEDDYIIQLYSDHGVPIYDTVPSVLSDNQTNAAYMMRGRGVPEKGMVEELTSAVDIYPALAVLAGFPVGEWVDGNLPAVLGGKERECVYSNSLFPGQTYKLCIRTKELEFYMESQEPVNEDGTVDLSGAEFSVNVRDGSRSAVEDSQTVAFFLRLAQNYTAHVNHEGRQWKSLVEARSEWYGKRIVNNGR